MIKKKVTRRRFLKYIFGSALLTAVVSPMYSHYFERFWIRTDQVQIPFSNLPNAFDGMKILHFSDVHLGFHYDIDDLTKLVQQMQEMKPDMICFTGDFVQQKFELLEQSIPILSSLDAPLGKYAVIGNHDYWVNAEDLYTQTLSESGFHVLINEHVPIELNGEHIYIAGVDDILYGRPSVKKAIKNVPENSFTILLAHEPDYADVTVQYPIQLQLSGHSHGGQIRLPLIGELITPPLGQKYVDRINQVGDLTVYTNRGVGTTGIPFRFFCRPEISMIELIRTEMISIRSQ